MAVRCAVSKFLRAIPVTADQYVTALSWNSKFRACAEFAARRERRSPFLIIGRHGKMSAWRPINLEPARGALT